MTLVNPFFPHNSPVGLVVDVATWKRPQHSTLAGVILLLLAAGCAYVAYGFWEPKILAEQLPQRGWGLEKQERKTLYVLAGCAALFACLFLIAAVTNFIPYDRGDRYFRAGPGGLSACVSGWFLEAQEFHIPWHDVKEWHVVEKIFVGDLSRFDHYHEKFPPCIHVKTVDGKRHEISTTDFQEMSNFIVENIERARTLAFPEMQT